MALSSTLAETALPTCGFGVHKRELAMALQMNAIGLRGLQQGFGNGSFLHFAGRRALSMQVA